MIRQLLCPTVLLCVLTVEPAQANPPVASYIFPAGGQRGTTVKVRVGGLFLHQRCGFEMLGPGVEVSSALHRTRTLWFEGPLLPLPDSQQAEDYPQDMAGEIKVSPAAALGVRHWRLWTSQGATPARMFAIGDLPEVVEDEIEGDPVPVAVTLPVTINGRIFPREDVDLWSFSARKGQSITCAVQAARLGSPLDSRLEILDPQGRPIAENDDGQSADSVLRFTAPADGTYQVRIHDIRFQGGPAYVYRLTVTTDPQVDRVYPLGGRRGSATRFELVGQGLPAEPVTIPLPADGPSAYAHRLAVGDKFTNPFLLELDDLPETLEAEPNDAGSHANPLSVPGVANGRIARPGDVDCWAVTARKGDVFELELHAARLGSPLSGVLTVLDAGSKELARAEGTGAATDPRLRFTAMANGIYVVRVADRFGSRGGPAFAYRLRITPPTAPNFRLQLAADAVTLNRGGQAKLRVTAERLENFAEPITLEIEGLPPGVTVTGTTIAAKQPTTDITFKADTSAPIRVARLTVRGSSKIGEGRVTRTAALSTPRGVPDIDSMLLAVALPTPFKIVGEYDMRWAARGTVHQRRYRLERNGYEGPVEVRLADRQARHLQGVTGPTVTVPAGTTEFGYAIHLPPWMETGRTSRVCVMGAGVIREADGSVYTVSFSSTAQNEQVVAVIEPGRLGLEVNPASLTAVPGGSTSVTVQVARGKGLDGSAKVELIAPTHLSGITAEPAVLAAGQTVGNLRLKFPATPAKLPDGTIVLRATILENGQPVVAEAKVMLSRER